MFVEQPGYTGSDKYLSYTIMLFVLLLVQDFIVIVVVVKCSFVVLCSNISLSFLETLAQYTPDSRCFVGLLLVFFGCFLCSQNFSVDTLIFFCHILKLFCKVFKLLKKTVMLVHLRFEPAQPKFLA